MSIAIIQYPRKTSIGAGIVGGIAGGAVMYGVMSALMIKLGMGANCFAIIMGMITGQSYENAIGPGIAAHFLTSIAIGAIFGAVISTKKLQLRGFGKGIGLGIATGIIAYVIIFLPIAMTVLPQHMMDLMKMMPMGSMGGNMSMKEKGSMNGSSQMNEKSSTSMATEKGSMGGQMNEKMKMEEMQKMMMEETQKMFPMILGGSLASHIAFGAALGVVVTSIVKRASAKSGTITP